MDFNENNIPDENEENGIDESLFPEEEYDEGEETERPRKMVTLKSAVIWAVIASLLFSCVMVPGTILFLRMRGYNELGLSRENWEKLKWGFETAENIYYGEADEKEKVDGALWGLSLSLDDYSEYMPKDEAEEFMNVVGENAYSGVGLYIVNNTEDNTILVIGILKDSPAEKAGIKAGDKVIAINDVPVSGIDLNKASEMMLGESGTKVNVTFIREKTGKTETIELTRDKIRVETVGGAMLDDNIGYIEISKFGTNTLEEFIEHYNDLCHEGMDKVIIDLRDNHGGYFDQAVNMADIFIDKGELIVYTKNKTGEKKEYRAVVDSVDIPMVILANKGTASASEVFIGAMLDHNKATLIGEKTFGKGVTQAVVSHPDGSIFKVTESKYYTPNGQCIDKTGIEPDISVSDDGEDDLVLEAGIKELKK